MLNLASNEGRTIRSSTEPNVAARPELENYIWIKEGNPPSLQVWNKITLVWECDVCNPYDALSLPSLAAPDISPLEGTLTDGFSFSHPVSGVVIWYSINGSAFVAYPGGTIRFGNPDYMYVAFYAIKAGYQRSDTVVVEYGQG